MFIRLIITLLLLISIFNSCQKEFENPNDISLNTTTADFKAKINGIEFVAAIAGAVRRNDGVISIAGKSNDGQIMSFTLVDSGMHVYTLDINSTRNYCGFEDNKGLVFSSNGGIDPGDSGGSLALVLIDSVNRTLSGTFNLKVFSSLDHVQRTINEGIFSNVPY